MGQLGGWAHPVEGHDVEAVLVAGLAVAEQPGPGEALDGGALPGADRLRAHAAGGRAAALHFDEGHERSAAGDQVEVTGGIKPGDRVVVRGGETLQPGQKVDIQARNGPDASVPARSG